MTTRVADTSFLYAAFDGADPRHEAALDEISRPQVLDIPLAVWAEFLDLVAYRQGQGVAHQVHDDLLRLATVRLASLKDEWDALQLWRHHDRISVADAAGIRAAQENKGELLSYDADQQQLLARLRAPTKDPQEP